jgi:N-methylhydantoinase B
MREYPAESMEPGDAIILNDLYMGSGHLPDFFITAPVFHDRALVGFVVDCAHQVDVGGAAAGSQAVEGMTEFYQEGIRVLPTKLWRGGEMNREVMRLITGNVRVPDIVEGDLKAMRNAARVGERRLLELFDRYGADTVLASWDDILAHSEREMRAAISEVPDGTLRGGGLLRRLRARHRPLARLRDGDRGGRRDHRGLRRLEPADPLRA